MGATPSSTRIDAPVITIGLAAGTDAMQIRATVYAELAIDGSDLGLYSVAADPKQLGDCSRGLAAVEQTQDLGLAIRQARETLVAVGPSARARGVDARLSPHSAAREKHRPDQQVARGVSPQCRGCSAAGKRPALLRCQKAREDDNAGFGMAHRHAAQDANVNRFPCDESSLRTVRGQSSKRVIAPDTRVDDPQQLRGAQNVAQTVRGKRPEPDEQDSRRFGGRALLSRRRLGGLRRALGLRA